MLVTSSATIAYALAEVVALRKLLSDKPMPIDDLVTANNCPLLRWMLANSTTLAILGDDSYKQKHQIAQEYR